MQSGAVGPDFRNSSADANACAGNPPTSAGPAARSASNRHHRQSRSTCLFLLRIHGTERSNVAQRAAQSYFGMSHLIPARPESQLNLQAGVLKASNLEQEESTGRPPRAMRQSLNHFLPGGSSSFAAILTNSARDSACIFRITCPRWIFTVISLVPSSEAICLLSMPETTSAMTSRSRAVSNS